MAEKAGAGGQGDTETAKGDQKETLTGDEGKNTPAPKGDDTVDTGGDKPGQKKADDKAAADKAAADKKATDDAAAAQKKTDDDAAAAAQKDKGSKDGEKPKAPDKYELKMPDDAGDYLDESDLKTVETLARAKGWTNEQAQAELEDYADNLAAQSARFREETEKDQTYGGDNLAETQRLARLALDKVRPANTAEGKALRRILAKSGYGNKLEVVSFLADLGKLMAEDSPAGNAHGAGADAKKDTASVLYGDS